MKMSKHARARGQQRAIPEEAVELILAFGTPERRPGNVMEYKILKRDASRIVNHLKRQIQLLDRIIDKAVLVNDEEDEIITMYNLN